MPKKIIYSVLVLIIIGLILWFSFWKKSDVPTQILSFDDCANAGYPVMESYPRQCNTPEGQHFVEELPVITYNNSSSNDIVVELPFPDAVVGKDFSVIGQARGGWYFEASFPIEILDKDGKVLAHIPAQAQGEWMTSEFVPFKADLKIPETYTGPATLVLKKDNPSGLPEKEASISFPITIEY
jgi:hypothetical protein